MDFTEKEVLIAEQLKTVGMQWRPRQGDFYADSNLRSFLVSKEEADRLVQEDYKMMDRVWLPSWRQCRELLAEMGFTLRDHSETVEHQGERGEEHFIGVAMESRHRGTFVGEGSTDLEAIYELVYKIISAAAHEQKAGTGSKRAQGKICSFCNNVMRLKEETGAWHYVCEGCGKRG
jgi:hypothetical protein